MFQNLQSLPHLLAPRLYSCAEQYRCELEKLFEPAWHLVGMTAELARDGDFISGVVLGRPVLVRNFGGELHAFLNVCTHRHALLTHCRAGNSPKLACQYHGWEYHGWEYHGWEYHGWEYRCDGSTGFIPDAQSFQPLPGGPEKLQKFRIAVSGPLVFVSLHEKHRSCRSFSGRRRHRCAIGLAEKQFVDSRCFGVLDWWLSS